MSKSTIKKASSKFLRSHEIDDMENVIVPLKKHKKTPNAGLFNLHMKDVHPLTENQGRVFNAYDHGKNLVCSGSAGTGKSFILLYLCLHDLMYSREYNKVMIFRSSVPTRNIGFLPGDEKEKLAVYEAPYKAICGDLFSRSDAYEILKKKDLIEFQSTSYVRGNTFDNCLIIVDECQDMNLHELSTVITRCGQGTKIFFSGDFKQCDFDGKREVSGFNDFIRIIGQIDSFEIVDFGLDDIVRSGLVKDYLVAKEKLNL